MALNAETLHRQARARETPDVFVEARSTLEERMSAADEARTRLHDLIREAHRKGVGPATLARWAGYDPSRIYQILGD